MDRLTLGLTGIALEDLTTGPKPLGTGEALRRLAEHVDVVETDSSGQPFLRGATAPEAVGHEAVGAALADRVRVQMAKEARGEGPAREPVRDVVAELDAIRRDLIESRTRRTGRTLDSILTKEGYLK